MSAATDSTTDMTKVYVRLLGEGTVVYRPAPATPVGVDTVLLSAPEGYDPDDEEWEFTPGSVVRVERRQLAGGEAFVAVSAVPRAP